MQTRFEQNQKGGYTIIETMISISLFAVVVVTGMGAFLNANVLHEKSQDQRSIMDSLSFVMEDMSRSLRTGYEYRCTPSAGSISTGNPLSCDSGWAIAFKPQDYDPASATNNKYWIYAITSFPIGSPAGIWKSTDSGANWVKLTPDEVVIDPAQTYAFSVLGAEPPSPSFSNRQQPLVNIKLIGKIVYKNNVETPFSLQTSVSQRLIDIAI